MNKQPLVSVIILTWNRINDLTETILEVKKSTYNNIEILVIDNGSSDGTKGIIKNKFPDIKLFCLNQNIGIGGYNIGMKNAQGEFIVLLDNDSFPEKHTIDRMVNYFKKDPQLAIAAFDVHNYNYMKEISKTVIESPTKGIKVTGYNGAGVGIRKKCLLRAGYLFEPFFLYFNEQDHALRIINNGYKIRLFNDLKGFHKQSLTARCNEKMAYYYTRNLLWLVWRLYPLKMMITTTIKIFYYSIIYSVIQKTDIYIKALFDGIKNIDIIFKGRTPVKSEIIKSARIPIALAFTVYR